MRQEVAAQTISQVTGIPEEAISPIANFAATVVDTLAGLPKAAEALTLATVETAMNVFDPEAVDTPEKREALMRVIKQQTGSGGFDEASGAFDPLKKQYDKGISESLASGDIASAASQTADQVAGAIPSVLATMTGAGGLAVIGASAFGGKFEEDLKNNPEETTASILGASLASAGYEVASEYVTHKLLAGAGLALNAGGKKAAAGYLKKASESILGGFLTEGGSEAAASVATELTDSVLYGKPVEKGIWARTLDTFLIGGIVGSGVTGIGKLNGPAKAYVEERTKPTSVQEADKKNADNINKARDIKNKSANPVEQTFVDDVIQENETETQERAKKHHKVTNELEPEEIVNIAEAKQTIDKANAVLNDPDALPSAKDLAWEQKQKAEKVIDDVYVMPIAEKELDLKIQEKNKDHRAKKQEIVNRLEAIEAERAALKAAEKPNPATTKKLDIKEKELKAELKSIEDVIEENKALVGKLRPHGSKGRYRDIVEAKQELLKKRDKGEKLSKKEQKLLQEAYKGVKKTKH